MRKFILLLMLYCFAVSSCKKDAVVFCMEGLILWGGDPAADGLGWYILTDSVTQQIYIPANLPDSFKKDQEKVKVCMYATKQMFYCECLQPLRKYHITYISRR